MGFIVTKLPANTENNDKKLIEMDMGNHHEVWLHRADYRFAPSQWETALLWNVSYWLGANLESALLVYYIRALAENRAHVANIVHILQFPPSWFYVWDLVVAKLQGINFVIEWREKLI